MISQLSDNPVGKVLAGISAGLLGMLLLLGVAWVLPPSGSEAADGEGGAGLSSDVPQLKPASPIETFAVITDRPVFNESRQPIIGVTEDDEADEEASEPEDIDAPEVELAGVVITPELRVATLRIKGSPESLMALEGQPLEGNFGSWFLSRIEPRSAILESGAGDQVRLELQIHDAMIDEPPETVQQEQAQDASDQEAGEDGAPMSRAEEIRQRIAERREELRRAAEEGEEPAAPAPQANYRQAIQAMMVGSRNQEEDENEQ